MRNDIALVELATPAQKTVGPVETIYEPIPVAKTATSISDGTECRVLGWGATTSGGSGPAVLTSMDVNYLAQRSLAATDFASFNGGYPVEAGMVGGEHAGYDYCTGDAGGAMIMPATNELVGIVSFGSDCNTNGVAGVYTNVPFYNDWMTEYVEGMSDLNGAAADVDLGNPDTDTDLCTSSTGKIVGIAVGATVGAILIIVLIVVCIKKQDNVHFFKGVVRRLSKRLSFSGNADKVAPTTDGVTPEEAVAAADVEEGAADGPMSPTQPDVGGVQSKGLCSYCGQPVLVTQEREKNRNGTYRHAKCLRLSYKGAH